MVVMDLQYEKGHLTKKGSQLKYSFKDDNVHQKERGLSNPGAEYGFPEGSVIPHNPIPALPASLLEYHYYHFHGWQLQKLKRLHKLQVHFGLCFNFPIVSIKRSEDLFLEVYRDLFLYINFTYQNINVSLNIDIHKYMNVTLNEKCPPGGELLC